MLCRSSTEENANSNFLVHNYTLMMGGSPGDKVLGEEGLEPPTSCL